MKYAKERRMEDNFAVLITVIPSVDKSWRDSN